jgi:hypothetical protein
MHRKMGPKTCGSLELVCGLHAGEKKGWLGFCACLCVYVCLWCLKKRDEKYKGG